MKKYYIYILRSKKYPEKYYIGFTEELEKRIEVHNNGQVSHTSKYKPWQLKTAIIYTDKDQAHKFEEYLKSSSGRAFSRKRL